MSKTGTIVRVILATSILAVAMWFVFRGVDVQAMVSILSRSDVFLLLLSVPIVVASHVVRARRWQTLLVPSGHTTHIGPAFNAVMIGYAANMFVPRSGEFIRPWVFSRRENLPVGTALSSVLIERVLDVLSLLIGISCVMFFAPERFAEILPGFTPSGIALRLGLPIGLLAVFVTMFVFTPLGVVFVHRMIRPLHEGFSLRCEQALTTIRHGMRAIGEPTLYLRLILETAAIWALYILPLWIVTMALPFASAHAVTLLDASIILVVIALGVTIAPTPGALGIYQSFAQAGLVALAGATATEGLAFGILTWLVNYGVAFIVGAICWMAESRHGLTFKTLRTTH